MDDGIYITKIRRTEKFRQNELAELAMEKLKDIDEVAYVRFASVYRQFPRYTDIYG